MPTLEDFKDSELEDQVAPDQITLPFDELSGGDTEEVVDLVSKSEAQSAEPTDIDSSTDA